MPVSPDKRTSSLMPKRPDTKALNKLWENMSATINKSPSSKPFKSRNLSSPTAKKFQNSSSQPCISGWLSKQSIKLLETTDKHTEKYNKGQKQKTVIQKSPKPLKVTSTKKKKHPNTSSTLSSMESVNDSKKSSKPTFTRNNSASSDELPTFKGKSSRKRPRETETFKKYGVIVPSLDDIVADQKQFTNYKTQVEEAQTLREPTFKMPQSPQKSSHSDDRLLDCKWLTMEEISEYFNNNKPFLRDIINGKKFSDRHRRYFDKKNKLDELTTKDLTYNTSTIVFTFEQIDYMISLLQTEFDPDDKKTGYFFKVLVPELCLKIFMKTHNMNKREANAYLENRPVE